MSIELGATGHAMLSSEFHDQHGHGTEMAVAAHRMAPDAKLLAVKIMGERLRTSAELMGAGIETSAKNGATIINLSIGTPNMGKHSACVSAVQMPSNLAQLYSQQRIQRATVPTPRICPKPSVLPHTRIALSTSRYFDPKRFPRKEWGTLSANTSHMATAKVRKVNGGVGVALESPPPI